MTSPTTRPRTAAGPLALVGLGLVALALLLWIPAAMTSMDHDWPDEARVAADGTAHRVAVEKGAETFVWTWQADVEPRCSVVGTDGEPVRLDPVEGHFERGGGTAAPWRATWSFVAPGAEVEVACDPAGDSAVMVQERPVLPGLLSGMSWVAWLDLLVLVTGVLSLLAALGLVVWRAVGRMAARPPRA